MADKRFPSLASFYAERSGARSGESDMGVMWRDGRAAFPTFRASIVHETGDVYAINQSTGEVELLGQLPGGSLVHFPTQEGNMCPYREAERRLLGWADERDLDWLRARLGA